jgi:hypothetical protein
LRVSSEITGGIFGGIDGSGQLAVPGTVSAAQIIEELIELAFYDALEVNDSAVCFASR